MKKSPIIEYSDCSLINFDIGLPMVDNLYMKPKLLNATNNDTILDLGRDYSVFLTYLKLKL